MAFRELEDQGGEGLRGRPLRDRPVLPARRRTRAWPPPQLLQDGTRSPAGHHASLLSKEPGRTNCRVVCSIGFLVSFLPGFLKICLNWHLAASVPEKRSTQASQEDLCPRKGRRGHGA